MDQYLPGNPPENPPGTPPDGNQGPTGGGGGDQNPGGNGGGDGDEAGLPGGGGDDLTPALSPSAGTGQTDAGSLPFTGYPLTALLLIVLLLLLGGLALRFGPTGVERLRGAYSSR